MVALPTANDLAMFPHLDDDKMFDLDYALQVQNEVQPNDDHPLWHEVMGWLFDLYMAYYAVATCTEVLSFSAGMDVLEMLDTAEFRMSPLFRDQDDLEDTALDAFEVLCVRLSRSEV